MILLARHWLHPAVIMSLAVTDSVLWWPSDAL